MQSSQEAESFVEYQTSIVILKHLPRYFLFCLFRDYKWKKRQDLWENVLQSGYE